MSKELLWTPSDKRIRSTELYKFMQKVNKKHNKDFRNYAQLYQWSIDNIPEFWADMWEEANVMASSYYEEIIDDITKMPGAKWFSGARLNFAQNLLRYRDNDPAIIFKGESMDVPVRITYAQLYNKVARVAESMRVRGLKVGDRVAGFMPNIPETIIAMLAATSIGAIWTSCSPDFGTKGALDRFGQIEPKMLFTANVYSYNGKKFDSLEKIKTIFSQLSSRPDIVVVPFTDEVIDISSVPNSILFDDFMCNESDPEI
jgi:acetoacetyl-CoA synthetase